jgi:peptidoglycan/xylan/chitin deacetylase (PgdA/CDA1 family)
MKQYQQASLYQYASLFMLAIILIVVTGCVSTEYGKHVSSVESGLSRTTWAMASTLTDHEETFYEASHVPVLLYHHMAPMEEGLHLNNGAIIPVEEFEAQMEYLSTNGYTTPTLREFDGWIKQERVLPAKTILLTFDDGYRSTYEYAFPILKKYGLRAVVFAIGNRFVKESGRFEHLEFADIEAMKELGLITIQSHSFDGHGGTPETSQLASLSEEQVMSDFSQLDTLFAENSLERPFSFAYPFGQSSESITKALQQFDYKLAFTTEHGFAETNDEPYNIKRIIIWPGTTLEQFKNRITPFENSETNQNTTQS